MKLTDTERLALVAIIIAIIIGLASIIPSSYIDFSEKTKGVIIISIVIVLIVVLFYAVFRLFVKSLEIDQLTSVQSLIFMVLFSFIFIGNDKSNPALCTETVSLDKIDEIEDHINFLTSTKNEIRLRDSLLMLFSPNTVVKEFRGGIPFYGGKIVQFFSELTSSSLQGKYKIIKIEYDCESRCFDILEVKVH